jgi:hypothetical protein
MTKEPIGKTIFTGILLAIATAIVGYLVSSIQQNRRDQFNYSEEQRQEEVRRVNEQIEKLYGPLYALIQANDTAWVHFAQTWQPRRENFFDTTVKLSEADIKTWRRWMRTVFQPLNEKMETAIVNNAQLLIGGTMPPAFRQFVSHTEAYKSTIAKWESASSPQDAQYFEATENVSPVCYPKAREFSDCIRKSFEALMTLQQQLQGKFVSESELRRMRHDLRAPQECEVQCSGFAHGEGQLNQPDSGEASSVSGGGSLPFTSEAGNMASGSVSSVSGGQNITQDTEFGWSAGSEADKVVVGNVRSP